MGKLKGLAAGAAGGFAGAALMGPVHLMAAKMIQRQSSQGEDATEKVANAVVKKATGRELERTKKKKGGQDCALRVWGEHRRAVRIAREHLPGRYHWRWDIFGHGGLRRRACPYCADARTRA